MKILITAFIFIFSFSAQAEKYSNYHRQLIEDSCILSPNHDKSSFAGLANNVCKCVSEKYIDFVNLKFNKNKEDLLKYALLYYSEKYDPSIFANSTQVYEEAFIALEVQCYEKITGESNISHDHNSEEE